MNTPDPDKPEADLILEQLIDGLEGRSSRVLQIMADFQKKDPVLNRESLDALGEFHFKMQAIDTKDASMWSIAQQIQSRNERYAQLRQLADNTTRKLQAELRKLEGARDQTRDDSAGQELTIDEREARIKRILGLE